MDPSGTAAAGAIARSALSWRLHRAQAGRARNRAIVCVAAAQPLARFARGQGTRRGRMRVTSAPGVDGMPATTRAAPATAGGRLKAARQAAGLSVDAVAQQLKLAPRQVTALEEDDWQHLPGRTFARGFARNYARFLQLDADEVLAMLPAPEAAPALERPALASSRRPMGDMPVERVARPSAARWLLPLLIIGLVAAAAY